jgi:hypothetical protein
VIPTALPGVRICEHLPRLAQHLDKLTIIRSGYSYNAGHGIADAYMLSGWRFSPATVYPSMGSIVARERPADPGMPPYIQLGRYVDQKTGGGLAGYLGNEHNPFVMTSDPNSERFSVDGIALPGGLTASRFARRRRMLDRFDRWQERVESQVSDSSAMDRFYEKAFGIVTSPRAKRAFDLLEEDSNLRDHYGRNTFGQSCLLARRLVEAGVRFVTVSFGGWDTHQQNFASLKDRLLPRLDTGYSALLADLRARGLLEQTIVVWMGDFGRTPKINSAAGRDHWPAPRSSASAAAASGWGRSSARATDTPRSRRPGWCRPRTSSPRSTRNWASRSTATTRIPTGGPSPSTRAGACCRN